jgi:DNA-binding GntR family transcriptional regulator
MVKQNLEEYAYTEIIALILEHRFKPGDVLLETELTDTLKLRSRTPVRHALTRLVAEGFLEKKKKRGYNIPFPSRDDARQAFFAREHIDGLTAAAAARNRTAEDITELRQLLTGEAETGTKGKKAIYSAINASFHAKIAELSGNSYLIQFSQQLFWRTSLYVFYFGGYYTADDFQRHMLAPPQHLEIVEAIAAGDESLARALMEHHVRFTADRVLPAIGF